MRGQTTRHPALVARELLLDDKFSANVRLSHLCLRDLLHGAGTGPPVDGNQVGGRPDSESTGVVVAVHDWWSPPRPSACDDPSLRRRACVDRPLDLFAADRL